MMKFNRLPISQISRIVGASHVVTDLEDRYCYGYDASKLKGLPDCVVFPGSTEEIARLLQLANKELFPVYPRGAGSGMVGAAIPENGGLVLSLHRLNRVLEIDSDNMIAVVEPGVVTGDFQKMLKPLGLFYPPDPASLQFSTIGGNIAMCSGGPMAVKYGVTRDYVLGLEAVLPTGTIVRTGTRTMKGVVGYDMTRLLVGSEGTLGVFTKAILRLIPAPESVRTLLVIFSNLEASMHAVCDIVRNRVIPCSLELMDQPTIRVVENYLSLGLPTEAEALLLIEVDGPDCLLDGEVEKIERICVQNRVSGVEVAHSEADRERLWRARRAVSPALGQIKPGKINEDVTVPRTQIPLLIRGIQELARKHNLLIVCFGHAGDGNIHTNIMLDRRNLDELHRAEMAVRDLFRMVLDLGGTLSGEHGVGITKSPFIEWEIGKEGMEAMWSIKKALDPRNILNPGKMFVVNRAFFQSELNIFKT